MDIRTGVGAILANVDQTKGCCYPAEVFTGTPTPSMRMLVDPIHPLIEECSDDLSQE